MVSFDTCPHLLLSLCISLFNRSISTCCRFAVASSLAYSESSSLVSSSSMLETSRKSSSNFICFSLSLLISFKRLVFSLVIYSNFLFRFSFSLMAFVNVAFVVVPRSGKGLHTFLSSSLFLSNEESSGVFRDLILSSFHCLSSSFDTRILLVVGHYCNLILFKKMKLNSF